MTFSEAVAMFSRHQHTPLPAVLDMDFEDFDHWFATMVDSMRSEAPSG